MKPDKVVCCMFLFTFLALHKTLRSNQEKSYDYVTHGRGPSNLSLSILVCSFDVCRASQPVSSINYAQ